MQIRIKISELMGKNKLNMKQLSDLTGIRQNTISSLYHENSKRIEIAQIEALCEALNCDVKDIFEYIKEEKRTR